MYQGDPTAIIGDPDATVLRSLRPYGDSTATIAFVQRLSCDCTNVLRLLRSNYVLTTMLLRLWRLHCDPTATYPGLSKNAEFLRLFCACSKNSPTVCDLVHPWVPRYDPAASLLRPWRLCCFLGRSKVAVRTQ